MEVVVGNNQVVYEDGYFLGQDNINIHYRKYIVRDSKASIVISHGFCETLEKYNELIKIFNDNHFSVYGIDHRGHGKSSRLGIDDSQINVQSFDHYVEDLKAFLDEIVMMNLGTEKLFLFAHSMGGAIGSLFLEKYDNYFDAAILNCPMMEIDTGDYPKLISRVVASIACILGKGYSYVLGHGPFTKTPNLESSGTSCKERYEKYFDRQLKYDYLQTSGASFRWLKEAFKATDYLLKKENVQKVNIPVILFQAGYDTFVKPNGQNKFAQYAKNCKLIRIEEAKHEIYIERDEILDGYIKEVFDFYNSNL